MQFNNPYGNFNNPYSNFNASGNFNNQNNFNNNYMNELAMARKREKHELFINASKLGGLLLIYELLNYIFVYFYYLVVYAVSSGSITLNTSTAILYLREHSEITGSSLFSMAGNLFVIALSVVVLMLIARFAMRIDFREMLKPQKGHVLSAAKWFPVCIMLNIVVSFAVSIFTSYMESAGVTIPESDFTLTDSSKWTIIAQFVYVIVLGPIAEELIYRGVVLTLLKPYGKGMAVFFSALIFGIMHGNVSQALTAFAGALVYAAVAVQCNSIVPTILIHIANNVIASYSDFADVLGWSHTDEILGAINITVILVGVYILVISGRQLLATDDNRYALTKGQRYRAVFFNIFMLIYFAYQILSFISSIISANM